MPIYQYECPDCGHTFEEIQGMSDKPIKKCPECGKKKVEKLIGGNKCAFLFNCPGFYTTDYKRP